MYMGYVIIFKILEETISGCNETSFRKPDLMSLLFTLFMPGSLPFLLLQAKLINSQTCLSCAMCMAKIDIHMGIVPMGSLHLDSILIEEQNQPFP